MGEAMEMMSRHRSAPAALALGLLLAAAPGWAAIERQRPKRKTQVVYRTHPVHKIELTQNRSTYGTLVVEEIRPGKAVVTDLRNSKRNAVRRMFKELFKSVSGLREITLELDDNDHQNYNRGYGNASPPPINSGDLRTQIVEQRERAGAKNTQIYRVLKSLGFGNVKEVWDADYDGVDVTFASKSLRQRKGERHLHR
jgi:hypothetical protein